MLKLETVLVDLFVLRTLCTIDDGFISIINVNVAHVAISAVVSVLRSLINPSPCPHAAAPTTEAKTNR